MRKKSLVVLAMAAAMVFGGAMTAHAEETQWYVYSKDSQDSDAPAKDNTAQADAWAERHKGNIVDIANVEERYAAVVNEVVSFLDYDVNYMDPMMYYTIRDEKGVCGDYTLLTGALCEKVGIEHEYVSGILLSADHPILRVNINGDWRYSDPTNYESGSAGLFGTANGWVADGQEMNKYFAATSCGNGGDETIRLSQLKDTDYTEVTDRYGHTAKVLRSDGIALAEGRMSLQEYLNKYGLRQ